MKKILLTAALAALTTTSAIAVEDVFYLKAQGGWSKFGKIKSFEAKNSGLIGVGVGYYFKDNVRTDLSLDYFFNPQFTNKAKTATVKANAASLLLNAYVDVHSTDAFKLFLGAGIGASQISAKYNLAAVAADTTVVPPITATAAVEEKHKNNTNFSFAIHAGASYELSPGVNTELAYSYRDLGTSAKVKYAAAANETSYQFRSHNVTLGLRFDM